jgi:hypothetical protein
MHRMDGYLTHDGEVNLPRLEMFMLELGGLEDTILAQRRIKDQRDRERRKREKEYAARRRGEPIPAAPSRPAGVDVYPVSFSTLRSSISSVCLMLFLGRLPRLLPSARTLAWAPPLHRLCPSWPIYPTPATTPRRRFCGLPC